MAHITRCPRGPPTNCPARQRIGCCTHSCTETRRGRSSKRSPMPIGNSNGNALAERPKERAGIGPSLWPGHP
eukprot:2650236-Pyramimonas_sp.AAC.1